MWAPRSIEFAYGFGLTFGAELNKVGCLAEPSIALFTFASRLSIRLPVLHNTIETLITCHLL